MSEINTGTIKFFNEEKGFGFIAQENSGKEFFVHANNLSQPVQKNVACEGAQE